MANCRDPLDAWDDNVPPITFYSSGCLPGRYVKKFSHVFATHTQQSHNSLNCAGVISLQILSGCTPLDRWNILSMAFSAELESSV